MLFFLELPVFPTAIESGGNDIRVTFDGWFGGVGLLYEFHQQLFWG
jgi:hypothetical protein